MRDSDLSVLKIMVGSEGASNLTSAEKLGRGAATCGFRAEIRLGACLWLSPILFT
jgi:hypothetical protein